MPKRLPERWQPESIREFRASALERFDDALALAASGRRTGAIYIWGYGAEMLLKAAYFSVIGFADTRPIVPIDIRDAITKARTIFNISWPKQGEGHNIGGWSELLIEERASLTMAYTPLFGAQLQMHGRRIGELWHVSQRYHKNIAYDHEATQVRKSVEWLLTHSHAL